jgi:transcription elongation GreA/GreB family factor
LILKRTASVSRAFVKEPDAGDAAADLPDRPISVHRNLVTAAGLKQIDAELDRFRRALDKAKASGDASATAAAARDLRYWTARAASAELAPPPTGDEVRFGSIVTVERDDGREQTFQITGEDEADPRVGTLSYVSPLARALIGRAAGDDVAFQSGTIVIRQVVAKG